MRQSGRAPKLGKEQPGRAVSAPSSSTLVFQVEVPGQHVRAGPQVEAVAGIQLLVDGHHHGGGVRGEHARDMLERVEDKLCFFKLEILVCWEI